MPAQPVLKRAAAALLLAVLAFGCGDGGSSGGPAATPGPVDDGRVNLTFLAELAGEPFACGRG